MTFRNNLKQNVFHYCKIHTDKIIFQKRVDTISVRKMYMHILVYL